MREILIENLKICYGSETVIDNFSYSISLNDITAIMAPSGRGKTTLLYALLKLITIDGGRISGVPESISVVFQEGRLFEDFNAYNNIFALMNKRKTGVTKNEIQQHLKELNLLEHAEKKTREWSGGMKRRLEIIRAVIAQSELIILDEPFKGIDDKNKEKVIDYILKNRRDRGIIMTTHNKSEIGMLNARLLEF